MTILNSAVRDHDPFFHVHEHWLVWRLAPDCTKIPIAELPTSRDVRTLLYCMGYEVGNVHLGTKKARKVVLAHLDRSKTRWLFDAARTMRRVVRRDYSDWLRMRTKAAE